MASVCQRCSIEAVGSYNIFCNAGDRRHIWDPPLPGDMQLQEDEQFKTLTSMPNHDPVDHPKHYNSHPSGIECIVVARHHNFNIGNVLKYIWRAGLKSGAGEHPPNNASTIQDLEKARWYLTDEINRLKEEK